MKTFLISMSFFLALRVGAAQELKLGAEIEVKKRTSIADLLRSPEEHLGKPVRIEGTVTEVCPRMGCWIEVRDSGETIQVKVRDGEIIFPRDSVGRSVVAQGTFTRIELSREQNIAWLEHEAEERGETIDTSGIVTGRTLYRLEGQGAVILQDQP